MSQSQLTYFLAGCAVGLILAVCNLALTRFFIKCEFRRLMQNQQSTNTKQTEQTYSWDKDALQFFDEATRDL